MRCSICNRRLKTDEISIGYDGNYEPCTACIQVAADLSTIFSSKEEEEETITTIPLVEKEEDDA